MAKELDTRSIRTEQKPDIEGDVAVRERPDIVRADAALDKDRLDALAFMEEPVTIRLSPSTDKNAAMYFPVWVNGKGCECWINGRWVEAPNGYIPVGVMLTVKRKYVEVIARAKVDAVSTVVEGEDTDRPNNRVKRFTTPVHSFSVLEDKNPKGAAWLTEIIRRNM